MTLAVTFGDLEEEVARELGWPRASASWSATQDSDFALIVNSGYRKFLSGEIPGENKQHNWSFLYPLAEIELSAGYSTGTIDTVDTDASVTITTGVWPSWAAQGELWFTPDAGGEEVRITVASRTSGSIIELDRAIVTAEIGDDITFNLRRVYYDLPADFGGIPTDSFAYRRDSAWHLPDVKVVGEADIRRVDRENSGNIYPRYASITPIAPTTTSQTTWLARFFPLAESTYTLEYRYKVAPAALTTSNTIPYGGSYYAEALIAAVIDSAVQKIHSSDERHANFQSCMRQAVFHDRRNFSTHSMGQGASSGRNSGGSLAEFRTNTSISTATLDWS